MLKAKIADLNVCFDHIHYGYFKDIYKEYLCEFNEENLRLTFNNDLIKVPSGKVIFSDGTFTLKEDESGIRHLISNYKNGEIQYVVSYNEDCSKSDIYINTQRSMGGAAPEIFEFVMATFAYNMKLIHDGGIIFHSSCIKFDNDAICFSAPSGTGKSTHTNLWADYFGDRVKFINDDKPAIRFKQDMAHAYGLPYSGKAFINSNVCAPVKAIVFINRAEQNSIRKIDGTEAVYKVLNQTIRNIHDTNLFDIQAKTIEKFILSVPCYELSCNMTVDAVKTCYNELYKK